MNSPYDERTKLTRSRLFPYTSYYPNKIYKQNDGLYVYTNTKGYIHVLKPSKISYDGEFSHYEIRDLLLKPDDIIKEVSSGGCYNTKEECILKIEENLVQNVE